jgi:hypothetical protein
MTPEFESAILILIKSLTVLVLAIAFRLVYPLLVKQ